MALHSIESARRDGSPLLVTDGANVAAAVWSGGREGMWAYKGPGAATQVDFEPTHWCDSASDILNGENA